MARTDTSRPHALPSAPEPPGGCCAPSAWTADGSVRDLPGWAGGHAGANRSLPTSNGDHELLESEGPRIRHRTCVLRDAIELTGEDLARRTLAAYADLLRDVDRRRIFRMWNFIPGIDARDGSGQDRYMRFNAGRFEAFARAPHAEHPFPTASGVGHAGRDLVLHLLEGPVAIETVDNPRQVPPERYSDRWGPVPPAFIRSAVVRDLEVDPLLIVSGTASVRGEATVHPEDLEGQLDETLANLLELLHRAGVATDAPRLDTALVYVPEADHLPRLRERIDAELGGGDFEYRVGRLCRSGLLVEIEGTLRLGTGRP